MFCYSESKETLKSKLFRKEQKTLKKQWLLLLSVFALALLLVACGGNDNESDTNTGTDDNKTEQTDEGTTKTDEQADENASNASYDADAAKASYQSCSGCHGGNLEGGAGPALSDVGARLSKEEILNVIKNGRPGMPAGLLQGDEAENVAAWLADQK